MTGTNWRRHMARERSRWMMLAAAAVYPELNVRTPCWFCSVSLNLIFLNGDKNKESVLLAFLAHHYRQRLDTNANIAFTWPVSSSKTIIIELAFVAKPIVVYLHLNRCICLVFSTKLIDWLVDWSEVCAPVLLRSVLNWLLPIIIEKNWKLDLKIELPE